MGLLPWLPNWGALCGINEEKREEVAKVRGRKEKNLCLPEGHLNSPFYPYRRLKTQNNFTQTLKL